MKGWGKGMVLEGQVAIVTGAGRGIGKQIALELAELGVDLALVARTVSQLEAVADEIRGLGRRALVLPGDVSSASFVDSMVKSVFKEFARIDILVNNAGVTRDNILLRMKEAEWDECLNINLKSAFLCTKAAARFMLKRRYGRIINLTSVIGLVGNPGQANYAASKAGLIGFTRSVAKELASRNITCNAVAPGYIETDMTAGLPDKLREDLLSQIPLGRLGQVEDVAGLVAFLASPRSGYITGQVFNVDGGMVM